MNVENFHNILYSILEELNLKETDLVKNFSYFEYVESTHKGYGYSHTEEEWLRQVIPMFTKK